MGMDMYLNVTGKNHRHVMEIVTAKKKEFEQFLNAEFNSPKWSELKELSEKMHKENFNDSDKLRFQKLSRRFFAVLRKKASSLGGRMVDNTHFVYKTPKSMVDAVDTIGSWSNESKLHEFIVKNFGNAKDDNQREIYLDEKDIERILRRFSKSKPELDMSPFRIALHVVRGGGVVFYYAWY